MKLNETEKMIQQQLKKELSIPDSVHDSLQEAYRKIENKEVLQEKPAGGKRWQKRAVKIGGGMAAALAAAQPPAVSVDTTELLAREGEKIWQRYARKASGYQLTMKVKQALFRKGFDYDEIEAWVNQQHPEA